MRKLDSHEKHLAEISQMARNIKDKYRQLSRHRNAVATALHSTKTALNMMDRLDKNPDEPVSEEYIKSSGKAVVDVTKAMHKEQQKILDKSTRKTSKEIKQLLDSVGTPVALFSVYLLFVVVCAFGLTHDLSSQLAHMCVRTCTQRTPRKHRMRT